MFRNVGRLGTRPITRRFVSSKTVESANTKLNSSKPALSNLGEEEWKAIEEQKMLDLTRDQITSILCDLSKHVPRGRLPVCQTHPSITLASYSKSLSSDELLGSFDASSFRSDHKQLTALGNLIFQLDSDNKYLSYFIWEIGVLKQEKNALYSLALLMMQSDCNFFNLDLCADLFSEADRLGHQYATYNLGMLYFTGQIGSTSNSDSVAPNYTRALELLLRAAELGVKQSYLNLGTMYLLGLGMDAPRGEEALKWFRRASDLGDPKAKLTLGDLYATGLRMPPTNGSSLDTHETEKWILKRNVWKAYQMWYEAAMEGRKLVSSEGDVMTDPKTASEALYSIGNCYFLGIGIPETAPRTSEDSVDDIELEQVIQDVPNYKMAKQFWDMATETDPGNLRAWLQLGNLYFDGIAGESKMGFKTDYERALWHYDRLIDEATKVGLIDDDGITPSTNSGNESKKSEEILLITAALVEMCHERLGVEPTASAPAISEQKSMGSAVGDLWDDLNERGNASKKRSMLDRLTGADNPDHERRFIDRLKSVDVREEAKYKAVKSHWKYVEDFNRRFYNEQLNKEEATVQNKKSWWKFW